MAGPVLSVAVQADTADLQAKLAAARIAYNGFTVELNKGAREAAKAGQDFNSTFSPAVANAAAGASRAKAQITALSAELSQRLKPAVEEASHAHGGLLGVLNSNKVAFSELEHTARATIDGLASGADPVRIFAQEFSRVAQAATSFNGISGSTIAAFGGIAAAAVAAGGALLGYLNYLRNIRQEAALSLQEGVFGRPIDTSSIRELVKNMREAGHSVDAFSELTEGDKLKIIRSFQDMDFGSKELTKALARMAPDFADAFGESAEQSVKSMTGALTDLTGKGSELMRQMGVTGDVLAEFQKKASESPKEAMVMFLNTLQDKLRQTTTSLNSTRVAATGFMAFFDTLKNRGVGGLLDLPATLPSGNIGFPVEAQRQIEAAKQSMKEYGDIKAGVAKIPDNLAPDMAAVRDGLDKIALNWRLTSDQITVQQADFLKNILEHDKMGAQERAQIQSEYDRTRVSALKAGGEVYMRELDAQAKEAAAKAGASRKDVVEAELSVYRNADITKLSGDQQIALQEKIASAQIRDNRATATEAKKTNQEIWEDYKAKSQQQIDEAKNNYTQKIAILKAEQTEALKIFGNTAQGRLEADKVGAEIAQANYDKMEQQLNATKTQLTTMANMAEAAGNLESIGAKNRPGEFKPSIGLVFDSSSLDSEVSAQIAKLKAKLTTDLAALSEEIKGTLDLAKSVQVSNPQQYAQLVEQASAAYAKMAELDKQFADQATELNQRAAQAVQQSWEKIVGPIGNAFDSLVSDALSGHQRISVAAEKAAASVLESWIKSIAKQVSAWVAGEAMKLFSSRATDTAIAATDQQGAAQELANIAKSLQQFVAAEQAKTGAAVAGGTAQATAQAAAASTGRAAQAAAGAKSVMGDAAKAFAGTYASVSEIPLVGWLLAPVAASAAFAAVAGYETLASAEGGWDRVPKDGSPAILHKNEMVLPARLAEGVRQMTAAGVNNPAASTASLQGSSSVVNRSGDVAHNVTLNHSPTINIQGTGNGTADYARAARSEGDRMYSRMQSWYGNNQVSLPGRKPWR